MNSTATTTPPPAAKRKHNPLLGNHMSSVVVSVIVNLGLLVLLLFMIQLSEPASKEETVFRMMDVEQVEMEDIQELIEPEDVEPDLTDDMTMDMNLEDMVTEMLDDSIPQEEAAIQPVVSPVIMEGLAQAAGINFNDYLVDGSRATRFMGQSGKGNRFAFVIDYSKSMNKQQLAVMKHELTSAIEAIGEKGMVSLLFFLRTGLASGSGCGGHFGALEKRLDRKNQPQFSQSTLAGSHGRESGGSGTDDSSDAHHSGKSCRSPRMISAMPLWTILKQTRHLSACWTLRSSNRRSEKKRTRFPSISEAKSGRFSQKLIIAPGGFLGFHRSQESGDASATFR